MGPFTRRARATLRAVKSPESPIYYGLIQRRAVLIIKTDSRADTRLLDDEWRPSLKSQIARKYRHRQKLADCARESFYPPHPALSSLRLNTGFPLALSLPPHVQHGSTSFLRPLARSRDRQPGTGDG